MKLWRYDGGIVFALILLFVYVAAVTSILWGLS